MVQADSDPKSCLSLEHAQFFRAGHDLCPETWSPRPAFSGLVTVDGPAGTSALATVLTADNNSLFIINMLLLSEQT